MCRRLPSLLLDQKKMPPGRAPGKSLVHGLKNTAYQIGSTLHFSVLIQFLQYDLLASSYRIPPSRLDHL
jgi:hypothetical protein